MSINKTYAVFGLGRYGRAVAEELVKNGADVIAIDNNEMLVNEAAQTIPVCKCADVTEPEVIDKLDIADVDVVIIAMANSLEATVMAITLCKEAGVPTVIAKCVEEMHGKIFERVGADRVVFPEKEAGTRLGKNLLSSGFVDIVELSKDASMVELQVKNEWIGKNLVQLNLRKKYSINVVAVIKGEEVITNIDPEMPLTENMKLIVIADVAKLEKLK
ncbi:MAG: TrkA family potassium uptake protein [Clostridia bacterium]|nr:TrkA family potassium uptake protein [Clostridia bacterium]